MPDITMCKGGNCPFKDKCYRYKAKPCKYQMYFIFEPYMESDDFGSCEYYIEKEYGKRK